MKNPPGNEVDQRDFHVVPAESAGRTPQDDTFCYSTITVGTGENSSFLMFSPVSTDKPPSLASSKIHSNRQVANGLPLFRCNKPSIGFLER